MKVFNHPLTKQLIAFACVGVFATVTHYLTAILFVDMFGGSIYIGNILGYLFAVFVSLYGHAIFTYQRELDRQLVKRFFFVSVCTLLLSESLVYLFEQYSILDHQYSMVIVVSSIPVLTFFLNKFWVYAHPKNS